MWNSLKLFWLYSFVNMILPIWHTNLNWSVFFYVERFWNNIYLNIFVWFERVWSYLCSTNSHESHYYSFGFFYIFLFEVTCSTQNRFIILFDPEDVGDFYFQWLLPNKVIVKQSVDQLHLNETISTDCKIHALVLEHPDLLR